MIRTVALLSAVALALAACRPGPRAPTAPSPGPTPIALDGTNEPMDPAEILRRTREAMSALTSFEALVTRGTVHAGPNRSSGLQLLQQTTYRYEPPDRHSYVVTSPLELNLRTPQPPLVEVNGESRRIGPHFWTRDVVGPAGEWTCTAYDIDPPNVLSYVPGRESEYLGVEETSLGARHHFVRRGDLSTSEQWIDAETYLVVRTQHIYVTEFGTEPGKVETETEWDSRILTAFDTPRQIFEPGSCQPKGSFLNTAEPGD